MEKSNCHRIRTEHRRPTSTSPRVLSFRSWVNELKSRPCTDCGHTFPSVAMDFDHVRGEKKLGISSMHSMSREMVEAEIQKCDLVCANCHRDRTCGASSSVRGPQMEMT